MNDFLRRKLFGKLFAEEDGNGTNNPGGTGEPSGNGKPDDGGTPKVTEREASLIKEVMSKKEAINTLKNQLQEVQNKLKDYDGIDIAEVRELLQKKADDEKKRADDEKKRLEEKGEWERLKAQMVEQHTKEKDELFARIEESQGEMSKLSSTIAELTVGSAFSQSQFIQNNLTLTPSKARIIYGSYFAYEDGKVVAYDKPVGSENRTPLVNASGDPLGFDEALKKIIDLDPEKEQIIRSRQRSGAGSNTSSKTNPQEKVTNLSPIDKIRLGVGHL